MSIHADTVTVIAHEDGAIVAHSGVSADRAVELMQAGIATIATRQYLFEKEALG